MQKKYLYVGLPIVLLLGILIMFGLYTNTSSLQGNLLGKKQGNMALVSLTINGKTIRPVALRDLSKGLKPILGRIDQRYGTNLASGKNGLIGSVVGMIGTGIIPGNMPSGGNVYINGNLNPFGRGTSPANDSSNMGLDNLEQFRDRNGFVSKDPSAEPPAPTPYAPIYDPKTGELVNPFGYVPIRGSNSGGNTSGSNTSGGNTSGSNTSGSDEPTDPNNPFGRVRIRYSDNPTSDSAYGKATESELSVNVLTKNGALGVGSNDSPDSLGELDEFGNSDYGTTNPGDGSGSRGNVDPNEISGVNITLDCARSMGETYCGSNGSVNIQISIVPNPRSGGVGGNPMR